MSESSAWEGLRVVLSGLGLDPKRVENVLAPGHPDVDYAGGNIELKYLEAFPKRSTTTVRLPEFTGEQSGWLAKRWEKGGLSWLMVKVGRAWYLFDGWTAMTIRSGVPASEWASLAAFVYPGTVGGGRGWGTAPAFEGAHCYSKQLGDWLRFDLDRLMPFHRAKAMRLRAREAISDVVDALVEKEVYDPTVVDVYSKVVAGEDGSDPEATETLIWLWEC